MASRRNSRRRPAQAAHIPSSLGTSLPPAGTRRWVARRKAQVVEAVQSGMLRLDEALRRYDLSIEEFSLWKSRFYRSGVEGLRMAPRPRHD
ncbi:MAG TPA: DUF1153 domain-containing protein [Allosphingosinicella sp.]|nr:DUF1153 domain-containing protein [Allosphingosinicella sp.]